jgi:hypothetical protein
MSTSASPVRSKKSTKALFSYRSITALLAATVLALLLVVLQNGRLQNDMRSLEEAVQKSQYEQAKACGLLTTKEASVLLGKDIITSGTLIDSRAPTASAQEGSPRIDGCSHVASQTNGAYIDISVRTYETENDAKAYMDKYVEKVLFIEKISTMKSSYDELYYAAGVHYARKGAQTLEVSAARNGAAFGDLQKEFSATIFATIENKLW